jgi:iron complex outermembrane receptor protein
LSKDSANGTLFSEDDRLSLRASVAYRSGYVTAFAGGARESSTEEGVNSALTVDASASYKLTDAVSLWAAARFFLPDSHGIRRAVRHTCVST